jgi:F-type H+-transporting ATPase subunit delta
MHPRLSGRYAKSLIDLAQEQNNLEAVYKDMLFLQEVCKSNRDFVNLLKSPVVKADKKAQIVDAVTAGKVTDITAKFNRLLISKGRESDLPEIVNAFIDMYNNIKGIHKVKLTTAEPVSEELKQSILKKINSDTSIEHIELESVVRNELIGGFILEFDNNMVDASILRDLKDIKKQFQQNIYVQQIR